MTLRQVDVFLAVARERSFSRAAQRIHLSQPTISEHVSELERELGKPLFLRRGRTVALTEAGRVWEAGSATRSLTERALQRAGVRFLAAMELDHTEAIKQGVMAGLGIAFVSRQAVRGEVAGGRVRAPRLRGLRIPRHFPVLHHDARGPAGR